MVFLKVKKNGHWAEERACQYLKMQGLKVLVRNYKTKQGEVDLIMKDKDDIVFVEVRERNNKHYGTALESITYHKQQKIILAATHYLQKKNWLHTIHGRFDVVSIEKNEIKWLKDAFTLG